MIRKTSNIVVSLLCLLGSSDVFASSDEREFVSATLLGSGNAGITDISGIEALFYNPASLARTPNLIDEIVVVSPQIEASQNGLNVYKDVKSNKNMLDIVSGAIGHPVSLGVQNATGASFRRTAFALFQRVDLQVGVKNDALSGIPTASAHSAVRAGAAFGVGRSFASNSLHVGATGLVVQRRKLIFQFLRWMRKANSVVKVAATYSMMPSSEALVLVHMWASFLHQAAPHHLSLQLSREIWG